LRWIRFLLYGDGYIIRGVQRILRAGSAFETILMFVVIFGSADS
jgi:hypothetical protein